MNSIIKKIKKKEEEPNNKIKTITLTFKGEEFTTYINVHNFN